MNQNNMSRNQSNGHPKYPGAGPLMTDHLHIKNLDRELEMLRRKREVVQREQQMLSMECEMDRKRQYEHSNHNTFGNVWQECPPKRANAPYQGQPWMSAPLGNLRPKMFKPMPSNYIPSLLSRKFNPPAIPMELKPIVHPILKNTVAQKLFRPINVRKDFRPTQITKKKPNVPPNKLNSYPVKVREDLVTKATGLQLAKNKAKTDSENPDMILREVQIPNKQVIGRLELALGNIVKEIRSSNSHIDKFKTLISSPSRQRIVKQAVRERIRTVMLNKTVGSVVDIVNAYREKFSTESDKDIVELVINSEQTKVVTNIGTESPEKFFKKNIGSILEKKIQEMSSNLLKMYTDVQRQTFLAGKKPGDFANKNLDESGKKQSVLNDEAAMKVIRSLTGKYVTVVERDALFRYYTELIEAVLEEKLPEYLPKCTEQFLKILDLDHQFKAIKSMANTRKRKSDKMVIKETETLNKDGINTETSDKEEALEQEIFNSEIKDTTIIENKKMEQEEVTENEEMEKVMATENNEMNPGAVTENKGMELEAIIESKEMEEETVTENKKMDEEVVTEKNKILSTESNIAQEETMIKKTTSSEIITPTTPITQKSESSMTKTIQSLPTTPKTPVTMSSPMSKDLPYYVKLIGRPKLPNRAAICEFLNSYRPSSIKKHKSINNLLVIGFNNQDDYNKIITANETVIGDITIVIKSSEKVITGKDNVSIKDEGNDTQKDIKDEDATKPDLQNENGICKETTQGNNSQNQDDAVDFIGKELDDQISELLSTISEVDEKPKSTETPHEPIKEGEVEIKSGETIETDKVDNSSKANVKETVRATPVRSSSRLGNITPSTIRTRRASRLMQE